MRILVTGGAGFIGSHLVDALIGRGDEVFVLDDLSTGRHEHVDARAILVHGSVLNEEAVRDMVAGVDAVYHLAAVVGVTRYMDEPRTTIDTNIRGTSNVVDACSEYQVPMLLTSTSEVYGLTQTLPMREDDPLVYGPTSRTRWCYGMSKALDEIVVMEACRDRGLDGRIVRLFNTVGSRQSGEYGFVLARFVEQAVAGLPITVHGDGGQTRTFCDVDDTVRAMMMLMETPEAKGLPVNIGSEQALMVMQLAVLVKMIVNSDSPIVTVPYADVFRHGFEDIPHRRPSVSRLRDLTGWVQTVSLTESIERAAAHARIARGEEIHAS